MLTELDVIGLIILRSSRFLNEFKPPFPSTSNVSHTRYSDNDCHTISALLSLANVLSISSFSCPNTSLGYLPVLRETLCVAFSFPTFSFNRIPP